MGTKPTLRVAHAFLLAACLIGFGTTTTTRAQPSYWLFESIPSRPLALSSDGTRLYAVNTPDAHLEIFDVSSTTPVHVGSVPVGLEPIAVALRNDGEAWVVNHLSDSVSIVDVSATPPRVVRTLLVGDAPGDVVFAGTDNGRAFVTTALRGQNTDDPLGSYDVPGIGRAAVWAFDAASPDPSTTSPAFTLFTDRPRALTTSPDGSTLYVAGFMTGNRTTIISEGIVCDGATDVTCSVPGGMTSIGGLPEPRRNVQGVLGPGVGLIVQYDPISQAWRDELERDWSPFVRFDLPDYDVFAVDASTYDVTAELPSVGTVLFAMATNPVTGKVYVTNTEALNRVRFEGHGTYARANDSKPEGEPLSVRGHLHEARITVIDGTSVTPRHLNPHLDYDAFPQPAEAKQRSVAQPLGIAVSGNGQTLYVAAFGSNVLSIIPTAALEAGTYSPSASNFVGLTGGGPTGLVLDEARNRLFVATRYDDGISVVSTSSSTEVAHVVMHTPEPTEVVWGRPLLYDARRSSSTGEASCGSCHIFGDLDQLAWDLGDPDINVLPDTNPRGPGGFAMNFHPLKGPMTTQTLRGMATHGPLHWRGDRSAGGDEAMDEHAAFIAFNGAFEGLLGRDEGEISDEEMSLFADFALTIALPPNPMRQLDNSLRANEQAAHDFYFETNVDTLATCDGCHTLNPSEGFFGTGGLTTFENETQLFKVAHLRNMYEKVGMFGMPAVDFFLSGDNGHKGEQIRGFGFLHDGSTDTIFRFFHATVFNPGFPNNPTGETRRRNMEAFMMVFDTDLAPIVGQQITIDAASDQDALDRLDLLHARAGTAFVLHRAPGARECDLVAHGVVNGEQRGFLRLADGTYTSDRASEAARTKEALVTLASMPGQHLTFTCTPPGSGNRMALDRDEDGVRDRDELDQGRSPIDRPLTTNPLDPGTPDGGVGDGGVDGGISGGGGGCGCVTAGEPKQSEAMPWLVALFALCVVSRRGRRER